MPGGVSEAKARVRARIAAQFATLDPRLGGRAASEAARHLSGSLHWANAARVALYVARSDELSTQAIAGAARRHGKPILWPRIVGRSLELAPAAASELVPGRFGIPAPPASCEAEPPGPDLLIVVPVRAFDWQGGRVGRGGGFYDRFLAAAGGAVSVGLAFSWQLESSLPLAAHDRSLDAVATEQGFFET